MHQIKQFSGNVCLYGNTRETNYKNTNHLLTTTSSQSFQMIRPLGAAGVSTS
jgi:hypothetical protein